MLRLRGRLMTEIHAYAFTEADDKIEAKKNKIVEPP